MGIQPSMHEHMIADRDRGRTTGQTVGQAERLTYIPAHIHRGRQGRQTVRHTYTQTRHAYRQPEHIHTYIPAYMPKLHIGGARDIQKGKCRQACRHTYRGIYIHTYIHTYTHTYIHTYTQAGRQSGRQTRIQTGR